MSTKSINEGGPAFPRTGGAFEGPNTSEWASPQEGMSLRDWFAGQALICLRFDSYSWQQNEHYWKNVAEAV